MVFSPPGQRSWHREGHPHGSCTVIAFPGPPGGSVDLPFVGSAMSNHEPMREYNTPSPTGSCTDTTGARTPVAVPVAATRLLALTTLPARRTPRPYSAPTAPTPGPLGLRPRPRSQGHPRV